MSKTTQLPPWFLAMLSMLPLVATAIAQEAKKDEVIKMEEFVAEEVVEDPNNAKVTAPSSAALGFSRTVVETPRSVTSVSSQLIDRIGIRDADQMFQVVPGTFTVNRWGIAGSTQVRNVTADTYIRGMKRIEPQGNVRNVITMWDNVEIVRGPPSPIYGNGRIGGYSNYTPKSARGSTGKYLEKAQGSITAIYGSYDKIETQVNYAQPVKVFGKQAGFQVFGQANDSDSYYKQNFQTDRVLQASFTMNLSDAWRIETGGIYQKAINAGQAGANRVSQKTFDNGTYLRGQALYNMDLNRDGSVSEDEIQRSRDALGTTDTTQFRGARPLVGNIVNVAPGTRLNANGYPITNLPINNATGATLLPSGFANFLENNYNPANGPYNNSRTKRLVDHIRSRQTDPNLRLEAPADTTVLVGTAVTPYTMGRFLPAGFPLDPDTVGYSPRDWSLVAIEEKADGNTYTGYFDLVNDTDPDYTLKNQILYDYQRQTKRSQLPFNQSQEIAAIEDKITFSVKKDKMPFIKDLPEWFTPEWLVSSNIRYSNAFGKSTSGDWDHRRDLMTGNTANDVFSSFLIDPDATSYIGGEPISTQTESKFVEAGAGTQLDLTFFKRFSILGGFRYDVINGMVNNGTTFNRTTFVDQNPYLPTIPGRAAGSAQPNAQTVQAAWDAAKASGFSDLPLTQGQSARNNDDGVSRSISFSYKVPYLEVTPYYTTGVATAALTDTRQNLALRDVINSSILGSSELVEWGVKGSLYKDKLFFGYANYRQKRAGNTVDVTGAGQLNTTANRGHEIELRYIPNKHWTFMTSATFSQSSRIFTSTEMRGTTNVGSGITAETMGFQDIKFGDDVYPANALLFGGNPAMQVFNRDIVEVGAYPQTVLTGFVGYNWTNGLSASVNVSYVSESYGNGQLIHQLVVPDYYLVNTSLAWENKVWRFALTVRNVIDEEYYVPNSNGGASPGGTLLQAGIPTNFELAATRKF